MLANTSRKLILAAAAFAVVFAVAEAGAKPVVIPKGPIKVAPKGPIIVKPVFPKKPPIIVTPKFPKKPPIIVKPIFPKPVIVSPVIVERPIVRSVAVVERPMASTCNCLTKDYTPDGQVVFKDLCTKEIAMAPVEGVQPQKASEADRPVNFAGKTYQDYLAANGSEQQN